MVNATLCSCYHGCKTAVSLSIPWQVRRKRPATKKGRATQAKYNSGSEYGVRARSHFLERGSRLYTIFKPSSSLLCHSLTLYWFFCSSLHFLFVCSLHYFWDIPVKILFIAWGEPCNNAVEGFLLPHPHPQPFFSCRHWHGQAETQICALTRIHRHTYIHGGKPVITGTVIVT